MPKNENIDYIYDKVNIVLKHGSIVTMCGTTQKEFKHGIEKSEHEVGSRIGLSFRQFK